MRGQTQRMSCGGGEVEGRKGHSVVCVITCFACICGVCTICQSMSVSAAAGADGGRKNRAGHWLCLCWGKEEGDNIAKRRSHYSSSESETILNVDILLSFSKMASARRTSLDMEDMNRDINQYKCLHVSFNIKAGQSLTDTKMLHLHATFIRSQICSLHSCLVSSQTLSRTAGSTAVIICEVTYN